MSFFKQSLALLLAGAFFASSLEGTGYVTDTGGYAYDESRAAVQIAPAIALGTIAIAGIIAIAVQNSHCNHSSSYSYSSHCHCD